MHRRKEVRELFERYRQGLCTPEELARLHAWFNRYAAHEASGLDDLRTAFETEHVTTSKRGLRWLPYAAAIFLAALVGSWVFYGARITDRLSAGRQGKPEIANTQDIAPGGNRATLTLANGQTIDLSSEQAGIIVADGITYLDGSQVMENEELKMKNERPGEENGILNSQFSILNSITTPKGGTYQVMLPDGTQVWLNAESTLSYPTRFEDDQRMVEISGEGYFSVAKDAKKPFKVYSLGQEIEVLGTEFNISAYPNETETKTTLVEGKVKVSNLESQAAKLLSSPGEQSTVRGAATETRNVEAEPYTAWKDGVFYFDNTPLEEMMKQLARWYEVDIIYESSAPKERFSGQMPRNVTMQTVLELLRVSEIDYRITGNRLIIK